MPRWMVLLLFLLAGLLGAPQMAHAARHRKPRHVIALDAGHGGRDPGALGLGGRLREKQVALDVALRVARTLRKRGISVRLSRASDRPLPPRQRARWLARTRSEMLLSIHCDSAVTPRPASGVTTYFHRGSTRSHLLARAVQHRLVKAARTRNRGVQPDTRRYRRGFYMLRRARRPAALIELGYISHRPTARRLIQPHYRQRLASGIAAGVVDYLHRTRNR